MSQSFVKPYTPPGAQSATRQQIEAAKERQDMEELVRLQQAQAKKVQASKAALLHTPLGLASLFPTNRSRVVVKKKGGGQGVQVAVETPQARLQAEAEALATPDAYQPVGDVASF